MPANFPQFSWDSTFPAPAKLNLFLHVVGRLPNGYHQLQTAFCLIDWCDFLRFAPDDKILLKTKIAGVSDDDNLCVKAARALQAATNCKKGAAIFLEKNLPQGGGLGGGSSDAASVLLALNFLWGTKLSQKELAEIALPLGADVPFFIFGQNAFGEGVGENLCAIDIPNRFYLIAIPKISCPTPLIFKDPFLKRDTPKISCESWQNQKTNDLQNVAIRLFPELKTLLDDFQKIAPHARMTGSGACFFAEFENEWRALEAQSVLSDYPSKIVRGIAAHPLQSLVF